MQTVRTTGKGLLSAATVALVLSLLLGAQFVPAGAQGTGGAGSGSDFVNMEFDAAPLAQVFQSLAEAADLNVLLDPSVDGEVSFVLRDITAREAIELVARITGYHQTVVGNTVVIASAKTLRDQFRTTEYRLLPVRNVELEPTAELIGRLHPEVSVIADAPTESLIVQGTAAELDAVADFLARYDGNYTEPLAFREADVQAVLWALADRAGWNLIVEGALDGRLTAHLEGMDYERALELVSDATALHYRLGDGVLYVRQLAPPVEDEPRRRVAIYRLDHVNPEKTAELVRGLYDDLFVDVDAETRSVIVEGDDTAVAGVDRFVRELDVPRRQVIVEARLEEINVDALHRLGMDWGEQRGFFDPTNIDPLVLAWNPADLRGRLEALNDDGLSKILASPKLAAIDGESANILIGDRIPILIRSEDEEGRISEMLEYIEAGIKLDIAAAIGQDDSVTLDIETEVSSVTSTTSDGIPQLRTREMSTRVRVQDGQSLVIGGLIEEDERESMRGLPFLKDLPLLGNLFSSKTTETVQTEMVVFLIPHIVHDTPAVSEAAPTPPGGEAGPEADGRDADGREASHVVHPEPGSLVADGKRPSPSDADLSIAWLDVTSNVMGAHDVQFERRTAQSGLLTGLYVAPRVGGYTLGGNVGVRRYGAEVAGISPWAGVGLEYIRPPGTDAGYIVSVNLGIATDEAAPLHLELFGQYTLLTHGFALPQPDVPARTTDLRTGLRLGWEY